MTENKRNPRKLRIWEQKQVTDILQLIIQFKTKLDLIIENTKDIDSLSQLPTSVLPTDTLYDICACYIAMYESLIDEGLITSGNTKTNQIIH